MKKTLSLITGIMFMAIGLYMISCCPKNQKNTNDEKKMGEVNTDTNKVYIWLSYFKCGEEDHLLMHDSYNHCAIDSLTTEALRGDSVIWSLDPNSGIKKLKEIEFKTDWELLIDADPVIDSSRNTIKIKIKKDATEGIYGYSIKFIVKDKKEVTIDPYIRVPPEE